MMRRILALILFSAAVASSNVHAEVLELEGTVKAVDASARSLSVTRTTPSGEKTLKLEVAKKAGDLAPVKVGDRITFSYDPDLEIVTKLEAGSSIASSSKPNARTEFLPLEELNTAESEHEQCVSEDGLCIVWATGGGDAWSVWQARRKDPDSLFTDKKRLYTGRAPVLSRDQLQLYFYSPDLNSIAHATRKSVDEEFGRPRPVKSLGFQTAALPRWLSSDGLTLYVDQVLDQKANKVSLLQIDRASEEDDWDQRSLVQAKFDGMKDGFRPTYPSGTPDPLQLLCGAGIAGVGPVVGVLSRDDRKATYERFVVIPLTNYEGKYPFVVRPQYVPATKELFVVSNAPITGPRNGPAAADIYVVKNVTLPVK